MGISKKKYNSEEIEITLDLDARTNGEHWWLRVLHSDNENLLNIRKELGLSDPFYPLHLSIGYANEKMIEHSEYIHSLIKNGYIKY